MIDIMQRDNSPRFKNSKFLQFLKDIDTEKIKIENNQVIENPEKIFDNAFNELQAA